MAREKKPRVPKEKKPIQLPKLKLPEKGSISFKRKKIKDKKISEKMTGISVAVGATVAIIIIYAAAMFIAMKVNVGNFFDVDYNNDRLQLVISGECDEIMNNMLRACITDDKEDRQAYIDAANEAAASMRTNYDTLLLTYNDPILGGQFDTAVVEENRMRQELIARLNNNNKDCLEYYNGKYYEQAQIIKTVSEKIGKKTGEAVASSYKKISTLTVAAIITLIILAVLAIVWILSYTRRVGQSIVGPMRKLQKAANRLAEGDLDISVAYDAKDEMGDLAGSIEEVVSRLKMLIPDINNLMGRMAEGDFTVKSDYEAEYIGCYEPILAAMKNISLKLTDTLQQITIAAQQVRAGSQNMAEGAQDLAEGATTQASAVEELTATVNELTNQIEYNAKATNEASKYASAVGEQASNSQQYMLQVNEAMKRIRETSEQIAEISSSIESIASKTNLLSLNAAIEAARAGEAGRGFAVVADQIRTLAGQSAEAAVNTRALIENALTEVQKGGKIVDNTTEVLTEVINSINAIVDSAKEVSLASERQAESAAQVNGGIEQIANAVQNTSATAEESSATSEELFAQAENLNSLVEQFVLPED
ncbi:MAG: HAMP domain-containing protein [Lachnospiraceae bacterium]|nr:HAMP domain-containing protein [Lachnospiraceae bacterium]